MALAAFGGVTRLAVGQRVALQVHHTVTPVAAFRVIPGGFLAHEEDRTLGAYLLLSRAVERFHGDDRAHRERLAAFAIAVAQALAIIAVHVRRFAVVAVHAVVAVAVGVAEHK